MKMSAQLYRVFPRFRYGLSNGSMTLAVQGQDHGIPIIEVEEMTYFGKIT